MTGGKLRRRIVDRGRQRGFALLAVLWMVVLLAAIAASFGRSARTEIQLARNAVEKAKAEALADAGVHRAVAGLLELEPERAWRAGGGPYAFTLGEGEVRVAIEDEDGKIDLNAAPEELLAGLFLAVGLAEADAEALAARIGERRDLEAQELLAETSGDEGTSGFVPTGAALPVFLVVEDLSSVPGMTPEIYARVAPAVTVYSQEPGLDLRAAPEAALLALPGASAEDVRRLLAARAEDDLELPLWPDAELYDIPSREIVYTIRAEARTRGGAIFVREATVALLGDPEAPFETLRWRRGETPRMQELE